MNTENLMKSVEVRVGGVCVTSEEVLMCEEPNYCQLFSTKRSLFSPLISSI